MIEETRNLPTLRLNVAVLPAVAVSVCVAGVVVVLVVGVVVI